MPVLVMELYKLLWVKKGIVVLAIAVVIVSNTGIKRDIHMIQIWL